MEYEQIRQSAKMRLCRALSSAVLAPLQDGIEKVRGSTPLISTIPEVRFAQWNQGRDAFFVFRISAPWMQQDTALDTVRHRQLMRGELGQETGHDPATLRSTI